MAVCADVTGLQTMGCSVRSRGDVVIQRYKLALHLLAKSRTYLQKYTASHPAKAIIIISAYFPHTSDIALVLAIRI